jgi:hypothetical protein
VSAPVTLLFTDLVDSPQLLQRVGDEGAQRLLKDTVAANGGQEVKWIGDGLMTVFASAADAVRAAVAMQQAARRHAAGERLGLRVGLHAGEALREETDYFGTPVVIARRLCEQEQAGQILASGVVVGLLAGRQAFEQRGPPVRADRVDEGAMLPFAVSFGAIQDERPWCIHPRRWAAGGRGERRTGTLMSADRGHARVLVPQGGRDIGRHVVTPDTPEAHTRGGIPGDPERTARLLDAALVQFRTLDVPG